MTTVMLVLPADVVWPALYLNEGLLTWWSIAAGLIAEFVALRWWIGFETKKAVKADLLMNLISTVVGVVLIPIAGLVWEIFPGQVIQWLLDVGTFNPLTWAGTCLLAVAINAILETGTLRFAFAVPSTRRVFFILCLANVVSVGLAMATIVIAEP